MHLCIRSLFDNFNFVEEISSLPFVYSFPYLFHILFFDCLYNTCDMIDLAAPVPVNDPEQMHRRLDECIHEILVTQYGFVENRTAWTLRQLLSASAIFTAIALHVYSVYYPLFKVTTLMAFCIACYYAQSVVLWFVGSVVERKSLLVTSPTAKHPYVLQVTTDLTENRESVRVRFVTFESSTLGKWTGIYGASVSSQAALDVERKLCGFYSSKGVLYPPEAMSFLQHHLRLIGVS